MCILMIKCKGMKLEISHLQFEELIKKSYSLDLIYLLKLIEDEYDVESLCKNSVKISALYKTLERKGLLSEFGKVTLIGKDLLKYAESNKDEKLVKKKSKESDFDKWWNAYPGTDTFTHAGQKFKGSRSLRHGKSECRRKFNNILMEGEYTASQLIKALEYQVKQKKDGSVSSKENKLRFMQNSLTYLNQRSFESYIELINQEEGEDSDYLSNVFDSTDI